MKRLATRLFALLFVFSFMLSLLSVVPAEAAALKINKAKAVLEVDATLKLKLGSLDGTESKWSSSDKKVATVSKAGTVTAKAEGIATITAVYNGGKYTCEVTVVDSNKEESQEEADLAASSTPKPAKTPSPTATPAPKSIKAPSTAATPTPKPAKTPAPTPTIAPSAAPAKSNTTTYILNVSTKKFHQTWCSSVKQMKDSNKRTLESTYAEMVNLGYSPCKKCFQ